MEPEVSIDKYLDTRCPECGDYFENYNNAKNHLYRFHPDELICPVCCDYYKTKKQLACHAKREHPLCGRCELRFKTKDEYYLHNLVTHIEESIIKNRILIGANTIQKRCRFCGVKLETRCYAHMHIQYAHPLLKPLYAHLRGQ